MIELTLILEIVIGIIVALIIFFSISYIKSKSPADQSIDQEITLAEWIIIAVVAAEHIYPGSERGKEKKAYVIEFLVFKGYVADKDMVSQEIDAMIESSISALKNGVIS